MMDSIYPSSPQQPPYPNMMMNNTGGYPYGYPPVAPQPMGYGIQMQPNPFASPFPQPQPAPFVPGVTVPMELQSANGTTITIPAQNGYNQGGARVSQGGFNPVSGTVTPPMAGQGFNPYTKFIGNPGYMQQPAQGFSPYVPQVPPIGLGAAGGFMNPMFGGMAPQYGVYQNQYNYQIQDILWNDEPSVVDVRAMLAKAVLTEEEREKIDHNRAAVMGTDYYNNPIYSNGNAAYYANQRRQEEFQQARLAHQKHFTMLSRIAHAATGETIDEEATMKLFDPVPPAPPMPKQFNPMTATPEEKDKVYRQNMVDYFHAIDLRMEQQEEYRRNYKQAMFAQIKASHDRLLGIEPGQSYDLKTYMENGYKIGINVAMQQAKSANRNGLNKYSQTAFRNTLGMQTNSVIPVTSKDDEYITTEDTIKSIFDRNRLHNYMMLGQTPKANVQSYTTGPVYSGKPGELLQFSSEEQAHAYFLQDIMEKKAENDARMAVR